MVASFQRYVKIKIEDIKIKPEGTKIPSLSSPASPSQYKLAHESGTVGAVIATSKLKTCKHHLFVRVAATGKNPYYIMINYCCSSPAEVKCQGKALLIKFKN